MITCVLKSVCKILLSLPDTKPNRQITNPIDHLPFLPIALPRDLPVFWHFGAFSGSLPHRSSPFLPSSPSLRKRYFGLLARPRPIFGLPPQIGRGNRAVSSPSSCCRLSGNHLQGCQVFIEISKIVHYHCDYFVILKAIRS